jgi:hypothetical protein
LILLGFLEEGGPKDGKKGVCDFLLETGEGNTK